MNYAYKKIDHVLPIITANIYQKNFNKQCISPEYAV